MITFVFSTLKPYIYQPKPSIIKQLTHQEIENEQRQFPVVIVCQDVSDPLNVGAIFRLADAMGANKVYLCGTSPKPPHKRISKTARSTDQMVPFAYENSTIKVISDLKEEGFSIVGLEITDQSHDISTFDFSTSFPVALVIGAESYGLSTDTLGLLDAAVHIPMHGQNTSMNVVQACGIALYEIIRQFKRL